MKVLIICNRIPFPLKDGGSIAMYKMAKGLLEAGCKITMLAMNTRKHYLPRDQWPPFLKKEIEFYAVDVNAEVRALDAFFNLFTTKSYNLDRFDNPAFRHKLCELLQLQQFDVIHFEGLYTSMYVNAARQFSQARMVLRSHNVENHIWHQLAHSTNNVLKKQYLKLLAARLKHAEHQVLSMFDAIVSISTQDADYFLSAGFKGKVLIAETGLDLIDYPFDEVGLEPVVFHIGSMDWIPNQQAIEWFLKKVWPKVIEKKPEARLHLAGRNFPKSFENLAAKNVFIDGEVENAVKYMAGKSVMVVPLFAGSGIRIKILEGMALGKCVVTTSKGAAGLDVQHQTHLLIADTPNDFAEAVVNCLSNATLSNQLRHNARKLVENRYSLRALSTKVLHFYAELIAAK